MINNMKGFSILELLIVIFIISVGFVAVFSLFTKSIATSAQVKNEIIAANLAAEAIEVIINIRSSNWLEDCPYDDFGTDCSSDVFPLDTNVNYNSASVSSTSDKLYLKNISGELYYTHDSSGEPTPFSRRVEINKLIDVDGISYREVRSIVTWEQFGKTKTVEIIDHLYDWKPQ